jgi:hypothetical protein
LYSVVPQRSLKIHPRYFARTELKNKVATGLALYQGTTLVVPQTPSQSWALAPALFPGQIGVTVGVLLWGINEPCLYRILSYVFPVLQPTLPVVDPHFGESMLPNFSLKSALISQTIGKTAFDELHCLLNRHGGGKCDEQVKMIRHDYKIM